MIARRVAFAIIASMGLSGCEVTNLQVRCRNDTQQAGGCFDAAFSIGAGWTRTTNDGQLSCLCLRRSGEWRELWRKPVE